MRKGCAPVSSFPNFSQLVRNLMLTKCRNKHRWPYILIPISHPPPFFSGLSYSLSASCPIATFLLRKCFPRPYKHTP